MPSRRSIADPAVDAYAEARTTPPPRHLQRIHDATWSDFSDSAGMLSGTIEGRLLETLVWIAEPRMVVEIGTYTGYGTLALAAALPADGRVVTLEVDAERHATALTHFDASPYKQRIDARLGDALAMLRSLTGPFDLVFIDADKPRYVDYYEAVMQKLAPRGLIVVDNTLFGGRVIDPPEGDRSAAALAAFNVHVAADERTVQVLLPARDGITLIRRAAT
jgi:caffeoyl-CoA O-methyltransferase